MGYVDSHYAVFHTGRVYLRDDLMVHADDQTHGVFAYQFFASHVQMAYSGKL